MADRILGHLDQNRVTRLQSRLDATRLAFKTNGIPVHFTGIEDGVTTTANINECGFHRGQHILHATEVDVADHRLLGATSNVVLHQQIIFEDRDLIQTIMISDHHLTIHGLATSQELRLSNTVATATFTTSFLATLLLRFQTSRPLESLHLVVNVTFVG